MQVVLENEYASLPSKGSANAIGYDLYSCEKKIVPARGRAVVNTGVVIQMPPGCYGRVAPRSGLAAKRGIDVGAGVIDADYRGVIGVVLFNHDDHDFHVDIGDRIAQLILEQALMGVTITQVQELSTTKRGADGFGSTGTQ
jgi:dUTP pyrophosphatase